MQHLSGLVCTPYVLSAHFFRTISIDGAGTDQLLSKEHCEIDDGFLCLRGSLYSILFDELIDNLDVALHKNYLSLMIQIALSQC